MLPVVERTTFAYAISKFLALVPGAEGSQEAAASLGAKGLLVDDRVWRWAATSFPGQSWMEIGKAILASQPSSSLDPQGPIVHLVGTLFPTYASKIGPLVQMYNDNPGQLTSVISDAISSPEAGRIAVQHVLAQPEELIRCHTCDEPFYTDGIRRCPFCQGD